MTDADDRPALAIELRDIVKRFPGVVANDGVNLKVRRGTILLDGTTVSFRSPREAIARGIGMVYQHFMLAGNLTVWENIVLGSEPGTQVWLDRRRARKRIRELGRQYGLEVDPDEFVSELGVGDKQRVEIIKVLFRGARIIILDEPTAVLVPHEVDELFDSLRQLTAEGVTIVFISHKLDEVLSVADDITVIRNGRTVAEVRPADVTARDLAELMVGHDLPRPEPRHDSPSDSVVLGVEDVTVAGTGRLAVEGVSLAVHRGEVVGIAGVEGNGQTELLDAVLGLRPLQRGSVRLGDRSLDRMSTRERREAGIGYIPEDRQKSGIVLTAPLWENVMLGHQGRAPFTDHGIIKLDAAKARTREVISSFDVRTPSENVAAIALSGGNQQKLIIGRELTSDPAVLVAAHPTRGVDVGAQAAVWDVIREARTNGLGVLLVSADLEELLALSDRLLVMLRGRVVAQLDPRSVTVAELGAYMTGAATPTGSEVA